MKVFVGKKKEKKRKLDNADASTITLIFGYTGWYSQWS